MKKEFKKSVLKTVAEAGLKSATLGANSASMLGFCQAKEPKKLKRSSTKMSGEDTRVLMRK